MYDDTLYVLCDVNAIVCIVDNPLYLQICDVTIKYVDIYADCIVIYNKDNRLL